MHRFMIGTFALVLLGPACGAQADKTPPKPGTPAEQYQSLVSEYRRMGKEAKANFDAAKVDTEKKKIVEEYQKNVNAIAGRLLGLAQAHPGDSAAVDALMMVMGIGTDADKDKAVAILRSLTEKSPDKTVQALAAYGVAQYLKQQLDESDLKPDASQKLAKEAEDLFDRAVKQLTGATDEKSKRLIAQADKQLFELRNLMIGKVAPDIEGIDGDGKKFKLSDYKGKVIVLDFWAGWCPPCMAMVPHERELVKRLEGKPFALIGINRDNTREEQQRVEKANKITWRSFFDGGDGPIGEKWNIQYLPTIFVLDHKGVIRYKGVRDKDMDQAVDTLLKEVPAAEKK